MDISNVKFLLSTPDYRELPSPRLPEYAFAGRSNVGKSSLLNSLTGSSMAFISSTPGKTQTINLFEVNETWTLADLPGYGYAKVSKKQRNKFQRMVNEYLVNRPNLLTTFVLVDSRHAPMESDLEFIYFLGASGLPLGIVMTKLDKLNRSQREKNIAHYREVLLESWEELPPMFFTSSETGEGREELLAYIEETNKVFDPARFAF